MSTLSFANQHNMIAFLQKPTKENEEFTEVVDFLNATHIRYALTVNPTVYVSNIKQFWATAKVKTIDEEVQIHARVDGQKIIVTEASVREVLHLGDVNGIENLPDSTIFENLQEMGYVRKNDSLKFNKGGFPPQWKFLIHTLLQCLSPKTTGWNEFSSNMASALICLAKNKEKFNFSKLIFDHVVKALDNSSNQHYLYPRFLQLLMDKQFTNKKVHDKVYPVHSHIKKVFSNMKRKGKDFPVIVKPLFQAMLELGQHKKGEGSRTYNESSSNGTDSGEGNRRCQETKGDNASDEDKSGEEEMELVKELMVKYTKLKEEVLGLKQITDTQGDVITGLKLRVKQLGGQKGSRTRSFKRLKKVGTRQRISSSESISLGEDDPKQGRNETKDSGEAMENFDSAAAGDDIGVDMDVDSGENDDEYVVADNQGNEVVMEAAIKGMGDSTAGASAEMAKEDTTAEENVPIASDDDETLAEAMILLKTRFKQAVPQSPLPTEQSQPPPQQPRVPVKGVVIREPTQQIKKSVQEPSYKGKGKGIMVEEPKHDPLKDLPFVYWPKHKQLEVDGAAARKLAALFAEENQMVLEQRRKHAEAEAKTKALLDSWDEERIKGDADIALMKQIKEEMQEYTQEQKDEWKRNYEAERKKFYLNQRKKRKVLSRPTVKQKRKYYEYYLNNMKGWKLVQLKRYSDDEIFKMYERAKNSM